MKKQTIFFVSLISIFILLCAAQAQYPETPQPKPIINFFFRVYYNDTVELIKLETDVGYNFSYTTGDYKTRIVSSDGRTLYESKVDILFLYNKVKKDGVLVNASVREFVDVYLSLPYYTEASRVELYHFDKLIYQKEIPKIYDSCGNEFCDSWENRENCPQDCFAETTTTTVRITTTTIKTYAKEPSYPSPSIIIFVLLISAVTFALVYRMKFQR